MRLTTICTAAALAMAATLPASGTAAVASASLPQVLDLDVSASAVAPVGVTSVPVTITAHVVSPVPDVDCFSSDYGPPSSWSGAMHASLAPLGAGTDPYPQVQMRLVSGTVEDGTWSGVLHAVSTRPGTWRVAALSGCDSALQPVWTDTTAMAVDIAIDGSEQPVLQVIDRPGTYGVVNTGWQVRVLTADGRVPDEVLLGHASDDDCLSASYAAPGWMPLDALGYGPVWTEISPPDCLVVSSGDAILFWRRLVGLWRFHPLGMRLASATVRVGAPLRVTGIVGPNVTYWPRTTIALQKRVSPNCWRTVATTQARPSGRFELQVVLPEARRYQLRVRASSVVSRTSLVPTVSSTHVVDVRR